MDDRQPDVLIEIRDLMRRQVVNSDLALERQNEAIARQVEAVKRARHGQKVLTILVIAVLVIYGLSIALPWVMVLLFRHAH